MELELVGIPLIRFTFGIYKWSFISSFKLPDCTCKCKFRNYKFINYSRNKVTEKWIWRIFVPGNWKWWRAPLTTFDLCECQCEIPTLLFFDPAQAILWQRETKINAQNKRKLVITAKMEIWETNLEYPHPKEQRMMKSSTSSLRSK